MPKIAVAIPTFRRPKSLRRLLNAVAALETRAEVSVIVADNDGADAEGLAVSEAAIASGYRWPLTAIAVPERGIAQVRNALVAAALSDPDVRFVAMIDDDEWPEPQWLEAFLATQAETQADALQGSIRFVAERGQDWRAAFDGVSDIRRPTGPVDILEGAGNLFLTRACLEALPRPWFDPAFALTGGEDRDFFLRLQKQGFRFAWCDEAMAQTLVPDTRLNLGWALRRAYSIGSSDMRVLLKHHPSVRARGIEAAKIAGAFAAAPALLLASAANPVGRADALRRVCRAAGKLHAMIGGRYEAYRVPHGE